MGTLRCPVLMGQVVKKEPVTLMPTQGSSEDEQLFLETKGAASLALSPSQIGDQKQNKPGASRRLLYIMLLIQT